MKRTLALAPLYLTLAIAGGVRAADPAGTAPIANPPASTATVAVATPSPAVAPAASAVVPPTPVAPAPADPVSVLQDKNKHLSEELATAWSDIDRLRGDLAAASTAASRRDEENANLRRQLDTFKAPPAVSEGDSKEDLGAKLAMALRSYALVDEENTQLKAKVDQDAAAQTNLNQQIDSARNAIAGLQTQAAATSQIEPLRTELRQAQDEIARLASENSQLRNRLSLGAPGPNQTIPEPTRPGTAAAENAAASAAAAATPVASPPPAPAPGRTYIVVEGDTLTRISLREYGTAARWKEILDANRNIIRDEKSLVVGASLKIP